jgi:hypothetical protein
LLSISSNSGQFFQPALTGASAVFRGSPSSAQEFLEVCFLEEAVTIYGMAMHLDLPLPSPIADRAFRNPEQTSGFLDSQVIPEISFHFF